jgi:hypothetical protein
MHRDTFGWILGSRPRALGRALGTVLLLSGCMGGQTGSEAGTGPDAGGCREVTTTSLPPNDTLATAGAACEMIQPDDATKLGFSPIKAVAMANELPALSFTWESGEATTLTLGVTLTQGSVPCLQRPSSGATLTSDVEITLITGDGRLNSRSTGTLVAEAMGDGSIAALELSGVRVCQSRDAASWALECGPSGLVLDGYAGLAVGFSARLQPTPIGTQVLGTIQFSGGRPGVCPTDSLLPCSPMTWEPVQGASFTND